MRFSERGETPEEQGGPDVRRASFSSSGVFVFHRSRSRDRQRSGMKRKPEVRKLIEKRRLGDLRSFTFDNPVAAAELKYQCEEGSVPDSVLLMLLATGYGKKRKDKISRGKSLAFVGRDGRPWDPRMRDMTSTTPEITPIQALTLGNPVVCSRLRYEFEEGIMRPAIYKWFIEHGPELLKQTERRPLLYFVGEKGLPWENDPWR